MITNLYDFTIFPALHLRNGQVVRFTQGDLANPTVYSSDPVSNAKLWIEEGASWLQVINLDAAFDEEGSHNWTLIKELCQLDINIQFGGGIRTLEDIDWAMKSGIKRVMLSTAAVENPQMVADAITAYGSDAVIVALDTDQEGQILTHGWTTTGGIEAMALGVQMRQLGITTVVHTNIHRDGSMSGVDLAISTELAQLTGLNVIAGGGVRSLDDVVECYNQPGISGVIIGKALHSGKINLSKALRAVRQKIAFETGLPAWKQEQQTVASQLLYDLSAQRLNPVLGNKPLRILDAGGGNGYDSLALAQQGHHIDLVDISQSMLADLQLEARERNLADLITAHTMNIRNIPQHFAAESFDVVLCHNVLQYIQDWESLLDVLLTPLKSGGILSLITLNRYALPYQLAFLDDDLEHARQLAETKHSSSIFATNVTEHTAEELQSALEQQGATLEAHYGLGCMYHHPKLHAGYNEDAQFYEQLQQLEMDLGEHSPYRDIARYLQLIVRKR